MKASVLWKDLEKTLIEQKFVYCILGVCGLLPACLIEQAPVGHGLSLLRCNEAQGSIFYLGNHETEARNKFVALGTA